MIFAIILVHGDLVSIARLRNYHLHPADLYLLINLVKSSDAFKGVESWVPVCLPRFDTRFRLTYERIFEETSLISLSVSLSVVGVCMHTSRI